MTLKEIDVLNYINISKVARTDQLSEKLNMSESTVRRILDRLDRQHRIIRFHGGASALTEEQMHTRLSSRFALKAKVKDHIARKAAEQVENGGTIILLGGTTVSYMCKYIRDKTLTVITNSMLVLDSLKFEQSIRLIFLGGIYDSEEAEVRGSLTGNALQQLGADALFCSVSGFDADRGFLSSNISDIELYSRCFQSVNKVCVLADSGKYQCRDLAVVARCSQVSLLVSDNGLPREAAERFRELGVEVALSD